MTTTHTTRPDENSSRTMVLDVVIPVHNEEHVLRQAVLRLYAYLSEHFAYPFRITVANNASTDGTVAVAGTVADSHPGVRVVHLDRKGRGHALRTTWLASDAAVLAYMDVDLSTDLAAVAPLGRSAHVGALGPGRRLADRRRIARGARRPA